MRMLSFVLALVLALPVSAQSPTVADLLSRAQVEASNYRQRPAPLTGTYVRQYVTRMGPVIAQVQANAADFKARYPNTGFLILVADPTSASEVASLASQLATLNAAGIEAFPGFRLCDTGTAALFNPGRGTTFKTAFDALWAARASSSLDFGFDVECYPPDLGQFTPSVLASLGKTQADVKAILAPMVDTMRVKGTPGAPIRLRIHPAHPTDTMVTELLAAADGAGELWTESSFPLPWDVFRRGVEGSQNDVVLVAQDVRAIEAFWSSASVRLGYNDDWLRAWKGPLAVSADARLDSIPRYPSWVFDYTRTDLSSFMQPTWQSGTSLSPLNDVAYVFTIGELSSTETALLSYPPLGTSSTELPAQLQGWTVNGVANSLIPAIKARRDGITIPASPVGGLRTTQRVLPTTHTWTLDLRFVLPAGNLGEDMPIVSPTQSNSKPWILRYRQSTDTIDLVIKIGSLTSLTLPVLVSPAREVETRVQIGRSGTTWLAGRTLYAGITPADPNYFLVFGGGWSSLWFGEGTMTNFPGLRFVGQQIVWHRLLPSEQLDMIPLNGGRYPWGRAQ